LGKHLHLVFQLFRSEILGVEFYCTGTLHFCPIYLTITLPITDL
jgi:hypothetical protein